MRGQLAKPAVRESFRSSPAKAGGQRTEGRSQNIGNTLLLIVYTPFVLFALSRELEAIGGEAGASGANP